MRRIHRKLHRKIRRRVRRHLGFFGVIRRYLDILAS